MPHTIDTDAWPLVRFTVVGAISLEEVEAMQRAMEALYERKQKFAVLVDARGFQVDRRLARPWGEWVKKNIEMIHAYNMGSALVNDSSLFRFLMSAMFLVQPLPHDYTITDSVEEAEAWTRKLLEKHGLLRSGDEHRAGIGA